MKQIDYYLQAFISGFKIQNKSNSEDSKLMSSSHNQKPMSLMLIMLEPQCVFLLRYFSQIDGREVLITGSKRMQERPIKILVDALNSIGADITYDKKKVILHCVLKEKLRVAL